MKDEEGCTLLSPGPCDSRLVGGECDWGGGQCLPSPPLQREEASTAPGSSAPRPHLRVLFYLLSVMVTRGLGREGDSANSSAQWKNPVTCPPGAGTGALCIWKGSLPHCFQGPFVFHLLEKKNKKTPHRLKYEAARPADAGFVGGMNPGDQ